MEINLVSDNNLQACERIIKTIEHEEPDRVPSYEDTIDNLAVCNHYGQKYFMQGIDRLHKTFNYLSFGSKKLMTKIMSKLAEGTIAAKKIVNNVSDLYRKIGIDLNHAVLCILPVEFNKTGMVSELGHRFEYYKNPSDGLTMAYYKGGVFKSFEDYERFPPLDPDRLVREKIFNAAKKYENDCKGDIYIAPAISGLMEATWEGFGLENFSKLLLNPKQIKKVFDDRGSFSVEMVKRIIDWGETGIIMILDDYGYKNGLFMRPKYYRDYIIPWIHQICTKAHKADLKVFLHSCGDILPIFEDLVKAGIDIFHPIEPTTANHEYDIFKLHKKFGDKITFCGNLNPQMLATGELSEVVTYAKCLIKRLAPGGGYIFSSGHSINPSVKLENFLAMRKILEKFGQYPINMNRIK